MRHIRIRRAGAIALALVVVTAGIAFADSVPADGDALAAGNQNLIDLGERAPGEVVTHDVAFTLVCGTITHADAGQTITVQASSFSAPLNGALAATSATIGPVPTTWPVDGEGCPTPNPTLAGNGSSTVTLTMPTTPGEGYIFTVMYARVGTTGLSGGTAISFQAEVVGNTPPTLSLPTPLTVEGSTTGGAAVAYTAAATDTEDDPDPTPVCAPASGSFFPLGTTVVSCWVTDTGGLSASGAFDVTVQDTTAPTLAGVPGDISLVTSDPAGTTLTYSPPTASDAVDASVAVACAPASGSFVALGASTVTCTAVDDSGNQVTASFAVSVAYEAGVDWSAAWDTPIAGSPAFLDANHGRTVPVKVDILANGVDVTTGAAWLRIVPCGGGDAKTVGLAWSSGRWGAHLDTSQLSAGCHVVTAVADGNDAGSFVLQLRGGDPAQASAKAPKGSARR